MTVAGLSLTFQSSPRLPPKPAGTPPSWLAQGLSSIQASGALSTTALREFEAILKNWDPKGGLEELAALGKVWQNRGEETAAASLWSLLKSTNSAASAVAGKELSSMLEAGDFGGRFEFLSSKFLRETADPRTLLPMLLCGFLGEATEALAYSRLKGVANPLLRRTAAGAAATLLEAPGFVGLQHALGGNSPAPLAQEFAAAALSLGSLRFFRLAGETTLKGLAEFGARNNAVELGKYLPFASKTLPLAAAFGALAATRAWEENLGWRPRSSPSVQWLDTLSSLLSWEIGTRLSRFALGKRVSGFRTPWSLKDLPEPASPNPGEFYVQTTPAERLILNEFFFLGRTPERITWKTWQKIQPRILYEARIIGDENGDKLPMNHKRFELQKIVIAFYGAKERHELRGGRPPKASPYIAKDPFPSPQKID
ncbi:MAG: hypothetical protein K8R69_03730 [Deltaproteobacteria bacterium]|nr:hypothetical protein [Deltaproteobacteria bacterium]